jgi:hypothetical protein
MRPPCRWARKAGKRLRAAEVIPERGEEALGAFEQTGVAPVELDQRAIRQPGREQIHRSSEPRSRAATADQQRGDSQTLKALDPRHWAASVEPLPSDAPGRWAFNQLRACDGCGLVRVRRGLRRRPQ